MLSRLIPFVSFDIISYAAGLTVISYWRFALATFIGIIPSSFLLAHFGRELATADMKRVGLTLILLSGITIAPFVIKKVRRRYFEKK